MSYPFLKIHSCSENVSNVDFVDIDPDIVKSGLAVVRDNKVINLESLSFVDLINAIDYMPSDKDGFIIKTIYQHGYRLEKITHPEPTKTI